VAFDDFLEGDALNGQFPFFIIEMLPGAGKNGLNGFHALSMNENESPVKGPSFDRGSLRER
jgi:hypothetical protein